MEIELDLDPIDWKQLELLAQLTPAERALAMMRAQAFVMAGLRGAFLNFPSLNSICKCWHIVRRFEVLWKKLRARAINDAKSR